MGLHEILLQTQKSSFWNIKCSRCHLESKKSILHKLLSGLQIKKRKKKEKENRKLCEISSSHGGEYDVQNCLLGCTAV
jgi:hypothetical protein